MVDREDDLSVGIKSTAILFGAMDRRIIALLQLMSLAAFVGAGVSFALGVSYYIAVGLVALMFLWHQHLIRERDKTDCFKAFNQSKWIGAIIFAGLVGHYALIGVSTV